MSLDNYQNMDPHLLIGVVNTLLRNHYTTLDELCIVEDVDKVRLIDILEKEDYLYHESINQFR